MGLSYFYLNDLKVVGSESCSMLVHWEQELPKHRSSSVCSNLDESSRLHRNRGIDLLRSHQPASRRHSLQERPGLAEGERSALLRKGPQAWRAWAGGGASPAGWVLRGAVSVRLREREDVLAPRGAPGERRAQRETAHPARAAPATLGSRSSAAAAREPPPRSGRLVPPRSVSR